MKFEKKKITSYFFVLLKKRVYDGAAECQGMDSDKTQLFVCSKIRRKCNFKSTKTHYLHFQNGKKKSIFAPEKSPKIAFLVVLNFFLVQKLIFCHF